MQSRGQGKGTGMETNLASSESDVRGDCAIVAALGRPFDEQMTRTRGWRLCVFSSAVE